MNLIKQPKGSSLCGQCVVAMLAAETLAASFENCAARPSIVSRAPSPRSSSDSRVWKLTRGQDFDVEPRHMKSTVHCAARRRNLDVVTKCEGDEALIIQVVGTIDLIPQ